MLRRSRLGARATRARAPGQKARVVQGRTGRAFAGVVGAAIGTAFTTRFQPVTDLDTGATEALVVSTAWQRSFGSLDLSQSENFRSLVNRQAELAAERLAHQQMADDLDRARRRAGAAADEHQGNEAHQGQGWPRVEQNTILAPVLSSDLVKNSIRVLAHSSKAMQYLRGLAVQAIGASVWRSLWWQ